MNLNKKLVISSLALLLAGAPTISILSPDNVVPIRTAQAANRQVIKLIVPASSSKIPLYDKKGSQIKGQSLKAGDTISFYGQPVLISKTYPKSGIFPTVKIKGKSYTSLGDGGYIPVNHTGGYTSKGMRIMRTTAVYDKNGKKLKTYRGKKATLSKGSVVKYGGSSTYKVTSSYFKVGAERYISAGDVQKMNGQPLITLNQNTYVYDKNGKKISFEGKNKLPSNSVVTTNSKIRTAKKSDQTYFYKSANYKNKSKLAFSTKKIKGQHYLSIGHGGYVKINNVKTANGMILYTKGPITVTLDNTATVYDSKFKKTRQTIAAGKKATLDKVVIDNHLSDPQLYFRIKGTNNLLYWGDFGEYPGADRTANIDPNYNSGNYSFWFKQFME